MTRRPVEALVLHEGMLDAGGALVIIVGVLLAVAAGGEHGNRLDKMLRARQPDSPEDWIHDTAARET